MKLLSGSLKDKIKQNRLAVGVSVGVLAAIYLVIYLLLFTSYSLVGKEDAAAAAPAWFDGNWAYRTPITIPSGTVDLDLPNFPLFLDITDSSLANAQSDADDIMFVDHSGAGVQLSHELVYYDDVSNQLKAWVEIPTIYAASDTTIYMYFGNATATAQEDPANTFNRYNGVWHFDEDVGALADVSVDAYADTTGKSDSADKYYTQTGFGVFDNALLLDTYNSSRALIDSTGSIALDGNEFYISFWMLTSNSTPLNLPNTLFQKGINDTSDNSYIEMYIDTDETLRVRELNTTNRGTTVTHDSNWHHYGLRYKPFAAVNNTRVYKDGVEIFNYSDNDGGGLTNSNGYKLYIGGRSTGNNYLDGKIDEFRIIKNFGENNANTAAWFKAEYDNVANSAFYSLGSAEEAGDISSVLVTTTNVISTNIDIPTADALLVGTLSIYDQYNGRDLESLLLTDTEGSVQDLFENMRAYYEYDTTSPYDCASVSYDGTESLYATGVQGYTDFEFTGSLPIYNDRSLCMYFVVDVVEPDVSIGDIDIPYQLEIADLDADITFSQGSINLASSDGIVALGSIQTPTPTVTVSAIGSENTIEAGEAVYLGGAFTFSINTDSANITAMTLTQNGSIDANTYMQEVRSYYEYDTSAPYDCTSESFDGTERMLSDPADPAPYSPITGYIFTFNSFYDTITVTPTQTMCLYLVSNNTYSGADTDFNIDLANPSGNVIATETVEPSTTVSPSGSGTVLGTPSGDALEWFDTNWGYRKEVYVDAADVVGSDDFYMHPVPVRVTDTDLQSSAQADADDIFFTNKFGTKLSHEIEYYDSATGELVAWVKVPHLYSTIDTPIYMYYGNSGAANQEDIENTWPSEFEMVHHFEEDFMSGSDNPVDSTANNHDTVTITDPSYGYTAQLDSPLGKGFGVISAGSAAGVDLDATPAGSLDPNGDFTVSLWFQADTSNNCGDMVAKRNSIAFYPGYENQYIINCQLTSGTNPGFNFTYGTGTDRANLPTTIVDETWYNVVAVKRGTDLEIYVDGTSTGATFDTYTGSDLPQDDAMDFEVPGINPLNGLKAEGTYDEVRFAPVARSAEWIETDYNLQVVGSTNSTSPEESINDDPIIASVTLNGGSNINLNEDSINTVSVTAQVTDANGYGDLASAYVTVYRSGVGASCTLDPNRCYQSTCSLINCSGNSCDVSCGVSLQYFAEPTDTGSIYESEYWLASLTVTDSFGSSDTETSPASTTDVNTLLALGISGSINFGSIYPGNDTGAVNAITNIENTGNAEINFEVSGADLCTDYPTCSGGVITVDNQEYNTAAFNFGTGIDLSSSPTEVTVNLAKATVINTPSTTQLFWGINIPTGLVPGSYTGQNTISAVSP